MKFSTTIFSLLVGSVAAFAPMPTTNHRSSSALNEKFEVQVCTHYAHEKGTDGHPFIMLVDGSKTSREVKIGGDIHQGSVNVHADVDFAGDVVTPKKVNLCKNGGGPWGFNSMYLTNEKTGQSYFYKGIHTLKDETRLTLDLTPAVTSSTYKDPDETWEEFEVKVYIGKPGTNAKVYIKLYDDKGRSTPAMRPGAGFGLDNPFNDWQEQTGQTAYLQALVGQDNAMGNIEKILIYIKKNVESNPKFYVKTVEVNGIKRNRLTGLIEERGQRKEFKIYRQLCENDNKYEFVQTGQVTYYGA